MMHWQRCPTENALLASILICRRDPVMLTEVIKTRSIPPFVQVLTYVEQNDVLTMTAICDGIEVLLEYGDRNKWYERQNTFVVAIKAMDPFGSLTAAIRRTLALLQADAPTKYPLMTLHFGATL